MVTEKPGQGRQVPYRVERLLLARLGNRVERRDLLWKDRNEAARREQRHFPTAIVLLLLW